MSVECWSDQIEHFSKTHPVLSYNWRGMGGTGARAPSILIQRSFHGLVSSFLRLLHIEQPCFADILSAA